MKNIKSFSLIALLFIAVSCNQNENGSDAWGNFESRETIISAQANGRLLSLEIEKGEEIESGQVVGLIDTVQYALNYRRLEAQKHAVKSRLRDIDANISVLQAQKKNLERELDRSRRLFNDQAATQQQLDDMEGKINVLDMQIEAAKVSRLNIDPEIEIINTQLELAREQLNYCTITNPVKGSVLETFAETHELVAPGKPLYKVADLSVMDLKVFISGGQLPQVALGQKVKVLIDQDASSTRELEGTVNWISSRAEFTPKTIQTREERINQVYAVKISVPNEDGAIKIGMPGEIIIND